MGIELGSLVDGRYRVEARVGAGGFGVVYAAFHLALERRVALKVLRQDALGRLDDVARSEAIARFIAEGRTLTRLRHPNIVSALDFGTMDGPDHGAGIPEPYLVLEWCEGETLASFVKRRGPLPLDEACALFEPIVDGMAHAHASRVVHRDLKPANVMVVVDGTGGGLSPRIVDFGIAQIAEGEAAPTGETRPEKRAGPHTPGYAAPEQIASGRTGPWTDVHALGLLFVELVTGRPPFDRTDDRADDELAIIDATRPTPGRKGIDVGALEAVMDKALSLRPAARYADAGALLAAFREARGLPSRAVIQAKPSAVALVPVRDDPRLPRTIGEPGLTVTDEGVGANVASGARAARRPGRRSLGFVALLGLLVLAGFGIRAGLLARAARGPTDPSDGRDLCTLTNEDVRRRLVRAGAAATYTADYGALTQRDRADRSVYFAFAPDAILSGVHIAAYPIVSGEAWVANGRYARRQTPQNPSPAVFATRGSCTLIFTGHATATPDTVRRAFDQFRHGLPLDVVDEWPGQPATTLAALPAWELENRAVSAGLVVDLAVTDDREGQLRFREPASAVLRMTSDAPSLMTAIRATASAYTQAGAKVVWVERLPSAEGAALLRRVLGPLATDVTENTPAAPPPSENAPPTAEAWQAARPLQERKQGQLTCDVRLLEGYRRAVCRPAQPGIEISLQVMGGSFETLIDEPDEVGMLFRADSVVRLAFSTPKDKVIYDSAKGGKFAPAR